MAVKILKSSKKIILVGSGIFILLFIGIYIIINSIIEKNAIKIISSSSTKENGIIERSDLDIWKFAFGNPPPEDVKIINAYGWSSDHFTRENKAYFEILPSKKWKLSFMKNYNLELIPESKTRDYRSTNHSKVPEWYIPKAKKDLGVEEYEIWDFKGYRGRVYILKENGHMFFSLINGRLN